MLLKFITQHSPKSTQNSQGGGTVRTVDNVMIYLSFYSFPFVCTIDKSVSCQIYGCLAGVARFEITSLEPCLQIFVVNKNIFGERGYAERKIGYGHDRNEIQPVAKGLFKILEKFEGLYTEYLCLSVKNMT